MRRIRPTDTDKNDRLRVELDLAESEAGRLRAVAGEMARALDGANKLLWVEGYTTAQPEVEAIVRALAKWRKEVAMGDTLEDDVARLREAVDKSRHQSLRDYFAGMALCGLLSANPCPEPERAAPSAYKYADAMLAERERDR